MSLLIVLVSTGARSPAIGRSHQLQLQLLAVTSLPKAADSHSSIVASLPPPALTLLDTCTAEGAITADEKSSDWLASGHSSTRAVREPELANGAVVYLCCADEQEVKDMEISLVLLTRLVLSLLSIVCLFIVWCLPFSLCNLVPGLTYMNHPHSFN